MQSKKEVTAQFMHLTDWLFEHGSQPAFGTHDSSCIEHAEQVAARAGFGKQDFEIQMLYGIRRDLQESLVKEGYRVRVYIPYGSAGTLPDAADGGEAHEPAVLHAFARW